jgi:hypothetical protein
MMRAWLCAALLPLPLQVLGGAGSGASTSFRHLCKTPYGDGIITSVRTEDGVASVSLMWGAILYCPASFAGVTQEQLDAADQQRRAELLDKRASTRRLSLVELAARTKGVCPTHACFFVVYVHAFV